MRSEDRENEMGEWASRMRNELPRGPGGGCQCGKSRQEEEESGPDTGGEERDTSIAVDGDEDYLENGRRTAEENLTSTQQASHARVQRRRHGAFTPFLHFPAYH